jgi:type IV secretory pathway VirB2 component (pilin)
MDRRLGMLLAVLALLTPTVAHAATGGGGLPWETPLQTLSNSISGPVAYGVSLIGLVVCGGVLIMMGGELNHFARTVIQAVLVISFIVAGKNTMSTFGWGAGAEIGNRVELRGEGVKYVSSGQNPQGGN